MDREALLKKVRALPDRPGVYLMHDATGKVIYVGKAKSLRKRVGSYFRHNQFASPRLRRLVSDVQDLSTMRTETEAEALVLESRLIKFYQPFFNIELKMGERYPYLKIKNEPFPRLIVTRHMEDDGSLYLGPFVKVSELRQLLRLVEHYFPLRTCALQLNGTPARDRPCMRYSLGRCLAPCVGYCDEEEYRERVDEVVLLLQGNGAALVERLRRRMERAAKSLQFEEAARVRDTIRAVWRVSRQRLVTPAFSEDIDAAWLSLVRLQAVLGLKTLPWRIDGFDISHLSGKEMIGVSVVFEQGAANPSLYRKFNIRDLDGIDDFRAIHQTVERRYKHALSGEEPLPQLILIDGGAVQLDFARQALEELGLETIPIVALAKREEALYLPDKSEPLFLEEGDPGRELLRRVRDEAHRFAISAHRIKRDRRLRQGLLEEIPGVGKRKASLLLSRFGSSRAIASLDDDQLMKVPGIGPVLAKRILEVLRGSTTNDDTGEKEK